MEIITQGSRPLLLQNDGSLSIFTIGVGSAFTKQHYQTNLLIIKGNDHLLVDCGTKTGQALYQLGLNITDIDNVVITHLHADHIGSLEELLLMNRYVARKKPNIYITKRFENMLWNYSLRGGCGFNEKHNNKELTFKDLCTVKRPVKIGSYSRETYAMNVGSINIKMFRTMHIPDSAVTWQESFWSCGLLIDNQVLFTSDTRYDPDMITFFTEKFSLDAVIHDCQLFTGGVHASLEELNSIPSVIKAKTILIHYGDNWKCFEHQIKHYGFHSFAKQWHHYRFSRKHFKECDF